jgi:AAA domain
VSFHDPLPDEDIPFGGPTLTAAPDEAKPFVGRSHAEVLSMEFEAERFLIDDLVPAGVVGTIAGVPETHKSWLAQAIAVRVGAVAGNVLGCNVVAGGPVGYIWQDDSTREESERVKLFERVHTSPDDLPVRWFLNEGVRLPADVARLRATVLQHGLVLLILDSFYNVLFGIDLKDEGAELVVAMLKREIADPTGCTVLIVDHMPWATDSNRQRLRAYGGVFKSAATRFGIYIDAQGKKLWIEARGNNMRGFRKTLAEWDPEQLELRLVETGEAPVAGEDYEQRIVDHLAANPWPTTTELDECVTGRGKELRAARQRLEATGHIKSVPSRDLGRIGNAKRWNLNNHAASDTSLTLGTDTDAETSVHPSAYVVGDGYRDGLGDGS